MKRTQEELRQQIREQGRDQFILQEMQRFGFWPKDEGKPSVEEELLQKEQELRSHLQKLTAQQRAQKNIKAQLRELRKARMKAARERRAETKAKREAERVAKAAAWREQQAKDITYLGEDVSYGLKNTEAATDRLASADLPRFNDIAELADAMKLSVSQLRWLTFNRKVSETSHYRRFQLPKKSGGVREISAPLPKLKAAQRWVLDNIIYRLDATEQAHGFVPDRGILSNALPHVGHTLVINLDLQNFFPTISYPRVKGLFQSIGYSEKLATIFALLSTEPATDYVEVDGKAYHVQTGERHLPQGAPGSPMITNLICRRLDARLQGVANKFGLTYTRYADDLTFSGDDAEHGPIVGKLLWQVRQIVKDENFILHPAKTKVMRKGARREVTGIVVNEKPNIARKKLRQFRAVLHQIDQNGPAGKTWGNGGDLFPALHGYAAHVHMVRPDLGGRLLTKVEELWRRYDPKYRAPGVRRTTRMAAAVAKTIEALPRPAMDEAQIEINAPTDPKKKSWWSRLFGE